MRALMIAGAAFASLVTARADDITADKTKQKDSCSYMLMDGQLVDLPVGANVCVRSPAPYTNEYAPASLLSAPSRGRPCKAR